MDSSFLATPVVQPANPLDSFMVSLRAQIAAEVKSEVTGDIIDRVVRIVSTAIGNPQINLTVNPIVDSVKLTAPTPIVDIEMNMDSLASELAATRTMLEKCMGAMSRPVQRTVNRGPDGLIQSITERYM